MKKFQITAGILTAVCLIIFAVTAVVQASLGLQLDTQSVCDRWAADGARYAQLSAFISPDAGVDANDIEGSMVQSLDSSYVEASIDANENARLYAYAYSGETTVTLSKKNQETGMTAKSGVRAAALGVGADFFIFHPIKLLTGSYIDTYDNVLNDTIIIDNDLAWQFFGSPDVVGQQLIVNGRVCYISGVCEPDEDYAEFYGEYPRLYMSYSLLSKLAGDLSVTCTEVCMPDPVKSFASDIFEKSLGISDEKLEIVENSRRFTSSGLFERLKSFSRRSVRTKLVAYPYWENAAVILADRAAILFIGKLIPIAVIFVLIVIELVIGYRRRKIFLDFIKRKISTGWEHFRQDRRRKQREGIEKKASEALRSAVGKSGE